MKDWGSWCLVKAQRIDFLGVLSLRQQRWGRREEKKIWEATLLLPQLLGL